MEEREEMRGLPPRASIPSRAATVLFAALLFAGAGAPAQRVVPEPSLRGSDFVELSALDSSIRYDIRYATERNFMGRKMYTEARALLQRPAALALLRAHRVLRKSGVGILVFDAYRPWRVTKLFWDETPPKNRGFVADPKKGSKHNRGCAVDCSLYEFATGREIPMPTPYDDFTDAAAPYALSGTAEQRSWRDVLRRTMEREGFQVEPKEWWHFDYREWRRFPVFDVPFERLPAH
jgi:D-alanyl-D-alanine dipeptidase